MTEAHTLVLGVGNILLQDEGVGVRVVEHLQHTYDFPDEVQVLDGGTMGMDLINFIEDLEHLLVIDAVDDGQPAGTILRLVDDEIPALLQRKMSPHQIGLSDILSVAKLRDRMPQHVVLIGIQPESLQTGLELSPRIQACMDELVAAVLRQLEEWEIPFVERETGDRRL
jgi:hydrogenase maturation protease